MPVDSLENAQAWRAAHRRRTRLPRKPTNGGDLTHALLAARVDREQADALTARVRANHAERRVLDVDRVEAIIARACSNARETLLGMCARLAPVLINQPDVHVVWALLNDEALRTPDRASGRGSGRAAGRLMPGEFLTRADAAELGRWHAARLQRLVDEVRPFLQRWAAASEDERDEVLAQFEAQVALKFANVGAALVLLADRLAVDGD